jgi:DNA repair protein RadC
MAKQKQFQTSLFPEPSYRVAEIQLSYKSIVPTSERPKITCSRDAYNILMESWDKNKLELLEQFKVLTLNRANRVTGIYEASQGGVAGTVADPKHIMVAALLNNASGIILAHSHPSGNLTPSQADMVLTKKLKEAGTFLELQVLDHLIVTPKGYYSFADEGIFP